MKKLFELLSHNDILVGLATLGGLIGLAVVVWQVAKFLWRFGRQVFTVGLPLALRQQGYRRALLAYRCAEDPAYFIATIIEDVLMRFLLALALGTQLALYYLESEPATASKAFVVSGVILAGIAWLGLAGLFFGFMGKFQLLARNVRRIIYSRHAHTGHRPAVWRKPKKPDRIVSA